MRISICFLMSYLNELHKKEADKNLPCGSSYQIFRSVLIWTNPGKCSNYFFHYYKAPEPIGNTNRWLSAAHVHQDMLPSVAKPSNELQCVSWTNALHHRFLWCAAIYSERILWRTVLMNKLLASVFSSVRCIVKWDWEKITEVGFKML